jgi:hypothetical protein
LSNASVNFKTASQQHFLLYAVMQHCLASLMTKL